MKWANSYMPRNIRPAAEQMHKGRDLAEVQVLTKDMSDEELVCENWCFHYRQFHGDLRGKDRRNPEFKAAQNKARLCSNELFRRGWLFWSDERLKQLGMRCASYRKMYGGNN